MSRKTPETPNAEASGPQASVPVLLGRPNPQGKGAVGLLDDWAASQPTRVVAKGPAQLLADYFTALLVLSSSFRFKPVKRQTYHLYFHDRDWNLSLVSPDEWGTEERQDGYVGACVLHDDATWTIEPSSNLGQPGPVSDALSAAYAGFIERLNSGADLETTLPVYAGQMPYQQRLLASVLSRSLTGSMRAAGLSGLSTDAWLELLPGNSTQLLGDIGDET